jgi:uncharacterized integral membrane protein (TIGR00697 family)
MIYAYLFSVILFCLIACILSGKKNPVFAQITFTIIIIFSFITVQKLININGFSIASITIGLYAISFFLIDFIIEIYDKKLAYQTIFIGLFSGILIAIILYFNIHIESVDFWQHQSSFNQVFGSTPRFAFAFIIAFLFAQLNNVFIFNLLKQITNGKYFFIRKNISTIISQGFDTIIFYGFAFYGILPNFESFVFYTFIIKVIISLIDTPFLYLAIWFVNKNEH